MIDQSLIWLGKLLVVRYMRYRSAYPARDFFESSCSSAERARFIAMARQLSETGKLPDATFGHFLKGRYAEIYEIKPHGTRFFGFFIDNVFYVTNAAKKKKSRDQETDYKRAVAMREDFLNRLAKATGEEG